MPDFISTKIYGHLRFIGIVKKRDEDLQSSALKSAFLSLDGIEGESHGGRIRPSCSRVSMIYEKGTIISNARQLCIMSEEELEEIRIEAKLPENRPEWWGASLSFEGIDELSALPPSSRLLFSSGACIRVDVENGPCSQTAKVVQSHTQGVAALIKSAAKHRRGVVGSVEREGEIKIGDQARLFVPNARAYAPILTG